MSSRIKILVTGAGGQLGAAFRHLAGSYPSLEFHLLGREELSVTDTAGFIALLNQLKPDWCINAAAYTKVDKAESENDIAFAVNGQAAGEMAMACKEAHCRFIHISTDYVFNGNNAVPYKEDHPIDPVNAYGASKAAGEKSVLENNPDSYILRTSWLYGKEGHNFVKTMQRLMQERDKLSVVNDQLGSPTNAEDLAKAILQIIMATPNIPSGVYHFSNSGTTTWHGFATAIKEMLHSSCEILPVDTAAYPTPAKRPAFSVLDTSKIKSALGIKIPDWRESLERYFHRS